MFNRLEVIMRTNKHANKHTPLQTSTSLPYATPVGNNLSGATDETSVHIIIGHQHSTAYIRRAHY